MNYELKEENGITYLHKNSAVAICPFKTPIPMPHPRLAGQFILVNSECCSSCPFFEVSKLEDKTLVFLECARETKTISVSNNETKPKLILT